MTAGGLSQLRRQWIPISADDAAMQREALAEKFRKTFLRRLKTMSMQVKVFWPDADEVLAKVAAKKWVVNVQAPPPKCQGSKALPIDQTIVIVIAAGADTEPVTAHIFAN